MMIKPSGMPQQTNKHLEQSSFLHCRQPKPHAACYVHGRSRLYCMHVLPCLLMQQDLGEQQPSWLYESIKQKCPAPLVCQQHHGLHGTHQWHATEWHFRSIVHIVGRSMEIHGSGSLLAAPLTGPGRLLCCRMESGFIAFLLYPLHMLCEASSSHLTTRHDVLARG